MDRVWARIAGAIWMTWLALLGGCGDRGERAEAGAASRTGTAAAPASACGADARLAAWCGFKNPEDLAVTPDGRFLLGTGFSALPDTYLNEMFLFDLAQRRKVEVEVALTENTWGDPACTRADTDFSPHGLSLVERADGTHQVAVTNHLPRETIELFELVADGDGWKLTWRGCVDAPSGDTFGVMFNDVALTRAGGFYATEMYDSHLPFDDLVTAGTNEENTGRVWRWDRDGGFAEVPGTEGSFPNGIALSPAEDVLFVNYWFTGTTIRYDIASATIEAEHIGGKADNLSHVGDDLWAAKHDMTLEGFLEACPAEQVACNLPFTIYRLSPVDLSVRGEWSFDSDVFGFATVAVPADGRVWLGTAHGDRIASFDPGA